MENQTNIEQLRNKFAHIKGWAHDADPKNEPTYPVKSYTGDDHHRLDWERPPLQEKTVEVLQSTEHPRTPAVFGTTLPPKGLSGLIRRKAFTFSENMMRHWFLLLMADRVDAVEGLLSDLAHAQMPRMGKERGLKVLWKHDKTLMMRRTAFRAAIYGAVIGYVAYNLLQNNTKQKADQKNKLLKRKKLQSQF